MRAKERKTGTEISRLTEPFLYKLVSGFKEASNNVVGLKKIFNW
jgi:hypothetical protein